ncbi:MAG: alkyl hydroperoxide reductase subunit F [Bacteroidia bacterium]|nr:MAG: alkyl hydroperoxide reductase subunit F [Bacteroidia bacterium]
MLEQNIKKQLKDVFKDLSSDFTLQIEVNPSHPNKEELIELLQETASCSENISVAVKEGENLSVRILKNGEITGIDFRAVPTGHEFSSLLTAILNLDGIGKNLPDPILTGRIQKLKGKPEFQTYISLSCTNCPEVVKSINAMAVLNPHISHQIIDGAIHKEQVEQRNIQAVPAVYLNGEPLHTGRASLAVLLEKTEKKLGTDYQKQDFQEKEYDLLVAGGGPAGISAAIYSVRKGLKVALIAETIGGQVTETVSIENMISVPQTSGKELAANLAKHLNDYPVDVFDNRRIQTCEIKNGYKHLILDSGEKFKAPALIIATGAGWRKLGIPGESEYIGNGVAFCAHCDGPFYKNKKVVVIGGGNSGLEAAIDLAGIASEVTVLEFLDQCKGDKILLEKINTLKNVHIHTNVQTLSIQGDGSKVQSLNYKERDTEEEKNLLTDGVFIQIGLSPNSQTFADCVETTPGGEIIIDSHARTNQAGIYAAGDVSTVPYKQIIVAMGEGAKAALSAFEDKIKDRLTVL